MEGRRALFIPSFSSYWVEFIVRECTAPEFNGMRCLILGTCEDYAEAASFPPSLMGYDVTVLVSGVYVRTTFQAYVISMYLMYLYFRLQLLPLWARVKTKYGGKQVVSIKRLMYYYCGS